MIGCDTIYTLEDKMIVYKAGCVLVNIKDKKIALVYRERHKDYSFPKGHLEMGEILRECAVRETEEETGRACRIVCDKPLNISRYISSKGEDTECHTFLAIDEGVSSKEIALKDKEFLVWSDFTEVESLLSYQNLKDMWNEIKPNVSNLLK